LTNVQKESIFAAQMLSVSICLEATDAHVDLGTWEMAAYVRVSVFFTLYFTSLLTSGSLLDVSPCSWHFNDIILTPLVLALTLQF